MNFWEFNPAFDDNGKIKYQDNCIVTVVSLGEIKNYPNRDFQNVEVEGPNQSRISGMSISYGKQETKLTPDDMNKPLKCRVKVENVAGQYSYNGKKYTFILGEKKQSSSGGGSSGGGGSSSSSGGYKKDPETQERILRTSCLYAVCNLFQGQGGSKTPELIIQYAQMFEPYIRGEV